MKRSVIGTTLALALLAAAPAASAAPTVPDGKCTTTNGAFTSFAPAGTNRIAQTFTALSSGFLSRAQMTVTKDPGSSGDYVLEVYGTDGSGVPAGTALASGTVSNSSVPDGDTPITADFAAPPHLTAGQQYAVAAGRPGSPDALVVRGATSNPCAGKGFQATQPAGPWAEVTFGGGTDYTLATFLVDDDADGVATGQDNCGGVSNPNQADSDHNGIGDACQDTDSDGVLDTTDNCKTVANPNQADANHNSIGDPCDTTVASVSGLAFSNATFVAQGSGPPATNARKRKPPHGTKVSFKLNEAATVRFTVTHRVKGRKVKRGKKTVCAKPTRKNRKRKHCTRVVTLKGSFSRTGVAGANSFHFTGRLRGRKLKPGRYRLVGTPTAGGKKGKPTSSAFRIVR